jgi:hypothetical protein
MVRRINSKIVVQVSPGIKQEPITKIIKAKRDEDIAQVAECPPNKQEALNSTPSTAKNTNK